MQGSKGGVEGSAFASQIKVMHLNERNFSFRSHKKQATDDC